MPTGSMIPWMLCAFLASIGASGVFGYYKGLEHAEAQQAHEELLIKQAAEAAQQAAAEAIAQIKIKNTVIKKEIQREIKTAPVYIECRNTDAGLQSINKALSGAHTVNDRKLPKIPGGAD